jgi:hypothetical protein
MQTKKKFSPFSRKKKFPLFVRKLVEARLTKPIKEIKNKKE